MNIVHHLAFNCHDRHAQEAFYTEQFGFKRARVLNAGRPDEFIILRSGKHVPGAFQRARHPARSGGVQAVGFKHLAFEVPSLEESIARLRAAGIEPDRIMDASGNVPGLRICFFRDPEGNSIELMQGWQDA